MSFKDRVSFWGGCIILLIQHRELCFHECSSSFSTCTLNTLYLFLPNSSFHFRNIYCANHLDTEANKTDLVLNPNGVQNTSERKTTYGWLFQVTSAS